MIRDSDATTRTPRLGRRDSDAATRTARTWLHRDRLDGHHKGVLSRPVTKTRSVTDGDGRSRPVAIAPHREGPMHSRGGEERAS